MSIRRERSDATRNGSSGQHDVAYATTGTGAGTGDSRSLTCITYRDEYIYAIIYLSYMPYTGFEDVDPARRPGPRGRSTGHPTFVRFALPFGALTSLFFTPTYGIRRVFGKPFVHGPR